MKFLHFFSSENSNDAAENGSCAENDGGAGAGAGTGAVNDEEEMVNKKNFYFYFFLAFGIFYSIFNLIENFFCFEQK